MQHCPARQRRYYNDLWVFDTEGLRWEQVARPGVAPAPRGGCQVRGLLPPTVDDFMSVMNTARRSRRPLIAQYRRCNSILKLPQNRCPALRGLQHTVAHDRYSPIECLQSLFSPSLKK